jgi:hypothetical protein
MSVTAKPQTSDSKVIVPATTKPHANHKKSAQKWSMCIRLYGVDFFFVLVNMV